MLVLTIRTDQPQAEVGLFDKGKKVAYKQWLAHRQLADTIHRTIADLLLERGLTIDELAAVVCYKGPGSFTGLRIGLTVANTLSYSQTIPVVSSGGENWIRTGLQKLNSGQDERIALPEYGAGANITKPKR